MKVFSVCGFTASGKTTTVEGIIKELKKRNYSVGSIKDIHFEEFRIDTEGTNTHRHKEAGAELVTARGVHETDILFPRQLDLYEIHRFYNYDYLVIEGMSDANIPHILTADKMEDLDSKFNDRVFMISGKIADEIEDYNGLKAISIFDDVESIVDTIEEKTFELLPDFDEKCCGACGLNCRTFCEAVVKGERNRSDCILSENNIELKINGKVIDMVPFVQQILKNAITGVVSELEGYQEKGHVEISMGSSYDCD